MTVVHTPRFILQPGIVEVRRAPGVEDETGHVGCDHATGLDEGTSGNAGAA